MSIYSQMPLRNVCVIISIRDQYLYDVVVSLDVRVRYFSDLVRGTLIQTINLIKIVKIRNVAMSKLVMGDTNVSFVV